MIGIQEHSAPVASRTESAKRAARVTFTWPGVAALALVLAFVGFVLWWTASTFDKTELKSWFAIGGVFVANKVWPVLQAYFHPVGEGIAAGNE